ncbi:3305_t:CDS:1, partial [Scutellospora calospora]
TNIIKERKSKAPLSEKNKYKKVQSIKPSDTKKERKSKALFPVKNKHKK